MRKSVPEGRKASLEKSVAANVPAAVNTVRRKKRETGKSSARAISREKQISLYAEAMKFFHTGNFAKAAKLFVQVTEGPGLEIAHAARMHGSVCARRLSSATLELKTPDDHYNYAITLINRGQFDPARQHLLQALGQLPDGDHVHYALAICYGAKGDLERAASHLKRAIELQPGIRITARNDADLAPIAREPQILDILYPEGTGAV